MKTLFLLSLLIYCLTTVRGSDTNNTATASTCDLVCVGGYNECMRGRTNVESQCACLRDLESCKQDYNCLSDQEKQQIESKCRYLGCYWCPQPTRTTEAPSKVMPTIMAVLFLAVAILAVVALRAVIEKRRREIYSNQPNQSIPMQNA